MDFAAIAAQVIANIAPYFAQVAVASVVEPLSGGITALVEAVRKKLKGDAFAEESLKRMEDKPDDPDRQAAMRSVLSEKLSADPDFAALLQGLLEKVEPAEAGSINQKVQLSGNARVGGDVIQVGRLEGGFKQEKP
jgi:hypothetical protein